MRAKVLRGYVALVLLGLYLLNVFRGASSNSGFFLCRILISRLTVHLSWKCRCANFLHEYAYTS